MPKTMDTVAFDRGVRPLLKLVLDQKADAVMQYRASASLRARIESLAARRSEARLSDSEKMEYAGYVRANKFVAILKRHARKLAP
jgi:hypothetical protein